MRIPIGPRRPKWDSRVFVPHQPLTSLSNWSTWHTPRAPDCGVKVKWGLWLERAPIYIAGGKRGAFLFSQTNTTFPFNCVVAKEGPLVLSLWSCGIALMNKKTDKSQKKLPSAAGFICKLEMLSVSCCWAIRLTSCGMQIKCSSRQRQPVFSVMFSFVRSN